METLENWCENYILQHPSYLVVLPYHSNQDVCLPLVATTCSSRASRYAYIAHLLPPPSPIFYPPLPLYDVRPSAASLSPPIGIGADALL